MNGNTLAVKDGRYTDVLCSLLRAVAGVTEIAKEHTQMPLDGARWDGYEWLPAETEDERSWLVLDHLICNLNAVLVAARAAERRAPSTKRVISYRLAKSRVAREPEGMPPDLTMLLEGFGRGVQL